eukprot:9845843-Alexandrium_andersonii.AAC.1
MSASLVGSEMCIRDRSNRASKVTRRWSRLPLAPAEADRLAAEAKLSCHCLLYTSDAADDM